MRTSAVNKVQQMKNSACKAHIPIVSKSRKKEHLRSSTSGSRRADCRCAYARAWVNFVWIVSHLAASPSTAASLPHPPSPTTPRRPRVRVRPPPSAQWYNVVPDSALPGPADAVLGAIREAVEQLFSDPHNPTAP